MGYIGSCIPFVLCLLLVLFYETIGISMETAMAGAFILTALWWVLMTLPLLKSYRQNYAIEAESHPVRSSGRRLLQIFGELWENPKILFFLVAFFFYIDGVYTIIDMATAYGTALGLDTTGLLLALLLTQIVAFPAALCFGRLSRKASSAKLILICIGAYFLVALYGITLTHQYQFWILAVCVGIFQGAIQSLSRAYYARIIPEEKSGEYFGVYDICGKGASFMGTTLVSAVSQVTGSTNLGVGALSIMFLIGFSYLQEWRRFAGKNYFHCVNTNKLPHRENLMREFPYTKKAPTCFFLFWLSETISALTEPDGQNRFLSYENRICHIRFKIFLFRRQNGSSEAKMPY